MGSKTCALNTDIPSRASIYIATRMPLCFHAPPVGKHPSARSGRPRLVRNAARFALKTEIKECLVVPSLLARAAQ